MSVLSLQPAAMSEQQLTTLISELLRSAEKAASVARSLRNETTLFDSIVEEKKEGKGNVILLTVNSSGRPNCHTFLQVKISALRKISRP